MTELRIGETLEVMTRGADTVISAFEQLPRREREEVIVELLRRVALDDHAGPTDDDLTAAAEELFVALDRQESRDR